MNDKLKEIKENWIDEGRWVKIKREHFEWLIKQTERVDKLQKNIERLEKMQNYMERLENRLGKRRKL